MPTKEERRELRDHFRGSLEAYAAACLKVKTKDSRLLPFHFNTAQRYLHQKIEEQLAETGMVRVIILKGRQMGCSTYVGARYYWKSTLWPYRNVYILAHKQDASDNLFEMVERFHEHNPIAPVTGTENAKELEFKAFDSRYTVAIAGHQPSGRSKTSHLFHGSEVAFWINPELHFAASVETVADMPGTEVILETTANGVDNRFYEEWQKAQNGESEYLPIFMPWYWMPEYRWPAPEGFEPSNERLDEDTPSEVELIEMFGLDYEQLAWRRRQISKPGWSVQVFNQEYPMTAEMAFIWSEATSLIKPMPVLRARKNEIEPSGPLIVGVDPAGQGGDRFAICGRRGHAVDFLDTRNKVSTNEAVAWIKSVIDEHDPARVFIDAGGIGSAIISAVKDLGRDYAMTVRAVNFGGTSQAKLAYPKMPGPKNRRAEMWQRMAEWLLLEEGVSIPDLDALQKDLCSAQTKATTTNDLLLESKQELRKKGIRSPDLADALALTFADLTYLGPEGGNPHIDKSPGHGHTNRVSQIIGVPNTGRHGWMV